ncbi:MAG: hypothetical protein HS126_12485 [Anaerolineales bacterium]|nr:hypothetical protein [Anaerolineales bacterium]
MSRELPPLPNHLKYRLNLSNHVTPRLLKDKPVHRWFYFPHSFSPKLVEILLTEWQVPTGSTVLDPFVGAGTTLYTSSRQGYNALGIDISPLSIFVSNTKVRVYDPPQIRQAVESITIMFRTGQHNIDLTRTDRLQQAFTDAEFNALKGLQQAILVQPEQVRDLLLLALLRVQQVVSRAKSDGGWFRWVEQDCQATSILPAFVDIVNTMLLDLIDTHGPYGLCLARQHDARQLVELQEWYPELMNDCQAIITSPPYPNRHDYSRIFQIELLTLGLNENDIFTLRYESLRSNVEAHPPERELPLFIVPERLQETLDLLPDDTDRRIDPMLRGYFEDMNAVMHSAFQVLTPGGYIALVVGNVRHAGVMIPVDEILIEVGETLGYKPLTSWVARLRGNSAQQMGRYGREPARESVVIFRKT